MALEKRGNRVVPCEPFIEVTDKIKKSLKRLHKKLHPHNYIEKRTHEKIINNWKHSEDYDSWVNVFIIEGNDISIAKSVLDSIGYCWEGYNFNSPYDCTGRAFSGEAIFYQFNDRIFVVHYWQLDV